MRWPGQKISIGLFLFNGGKKWIKRFARGAISFQKKSSIFVLIAFFILWPIHPLQNSLVTGWGKNEGVMRKEKVKNSVRR
jgi:hypothetical protein